MASIDGQFRALLGLDKYGDMTDSEIQMNQTEEVATNSALWATEGLKKAGLNPILAANSGISSASMASSGGAINTTNNNTNLINSAIKLGTVIAAISTKNPRLLGNLFKK